MPKEFETPMMKQYLEIKKKYKDCLLLFRLGDFYELFLEDAKIAANILDITLTSRDRGSDGKIPMAGVPYHAIDSYLSKLVKAGFKVAICEQLSDPSKQGLVKRDVVRIVTPGTILDEKALEKRENNYIVSISINKNTLGVAACDISTGDFFISEFLGDPLKNIAAEMHNFNPKECVLTENLYNNSEILKTLKTHKDISINNFIEGSDFQNNSLQQVKDHFKVKSLKGFGINEKSIAIEATSILLGYIKHTQKSNITHINKIKNYNKNNHVYLDQSTLINLEIFSTLREGNKKGSLIEHLDRTNTAMGGRLLRKWILKPLINKNLIKIRHLGIEELIKNPFKRGEIKKRLQNIIDIERLLSRLSVGMGNPKDLIGLKESLFKVLETKKEIDSLKSVLIISIFKNIPNNIENVIDYINKTIVPEPPIDLKQGKIINKGISKKLDQLKNEIKDSKEYIAKLEEKEKESTKINTLKVKFNKVFGYYIEVSKANSKKVPTRYYRKQTLVNAERYITEELKKHEEIILTAEEKINKIEYELFIQTVNKILENTIRIQKAARAIAKLDVAVNFAEIAEKENYTKPIIKNNNCIEIIEGRHPVVEKSLENSYFVSNNTLTDTHKNQLLIITGPNMGGKSVYIRQVALITLLAQIGSFVPAKKATIGIVDKIFVRSGASDVITSNLSTFMVEMVETANILNNATNKTLIIMDEVGRGTSTYDGISIAKAVAKYLISNSKNIHPRTLFATHYHELQQLEQEYKNKVKNYQTAIKEENGHPVFLHKVIKGGADHSFGIEVAKLAGVPTEVTSMAKEILVDLEKRYTDTSNKKYSVNTKMAENTNTKHKQLIDKVKYTNINKVTPVEALNILNEMIKLIK